MCKIRGRRKKKKEKESLAVLLPDDLFDLFEDTSPSFPGYMRSPCEGDLRPGATRGEKRKKKRKGSGPF